jgi:hypothetical protein
MIVEKDIVDELTLASLLLKIEKLEGRIDDLEKHRDEGGVEMEGAPQYVRDYVTETYTK